MKKISYKTLMALVGAVLLLLQNLGIRVNVEVVDIITTSIGGILVALGVILPDKKVEKTKDVKEETKAEE